MTKHKTPYPKDIVAPRLNSQGFNTNDFAVLDKMHTEIEKYTSKNTYKAKPIVSGVKSDKETAEDVINPNTNEVIGSVVNADAKTAKRALKNAQSAFNDWNNTPATQRAEILERFADLLEKSTNEFIAGGKELGGQPKEKSTKVIASKSCTKKLKFFDCIIGLRFGFYIYTYLHVKNPQNLT